MTENFPKLGRYLDIQVLEAHISPNNVNLKITSPQHIIIKLSKIKDKEKILNDARKKELITYKGKPIWLSVDFS